MEAFGKPDCFVSVGFHDILVPSVTLDVYLENIEWYLRLLQPHCSQIIWISMTAPRSNHYLQTKAKTLTWNEGARQSLAKRFSGNSNKDNSYNHKPIAFVDVYHASNGFPSRDNIHMSPEWYEALGNFLGDIMDACRPNAATQ